MIGYFDYTVWLTYLSLLSAGLGIMVSLQGEGHPYMGIFFLLFCGFCDAFDGTVARTKKNRTEQQKKFGIQIDSLSDLVAFGVLPACIGNAMIRVSPILQEKPTFHTGNPYDGTIIVLLYTVILVFILMALVRLAFFNVMEEERQQVEEGARKYFQGLPVTSAALIFPTIMLLQFVLPVDITAFYFAAMLITSLLFVVNVEIPKPGLRGVIIMCIIGALEFVTFCIAWRIFG